MCTVEVGSLHTHIGSIAFKLFNFGQTFRVAFHKLPTIIWVNFGPFLLTELVQLSQDCRPPCSHKLFQYCSHIFYRNDKLERKREGVAELDSERKAM